MAKLTCRRSGVCVAEDEEKGSMESSWRVCATVLEGPQLLQRAPTEVAAAGSWWFSVLTWSSSTQCACAALLTDLRWLIDFSFLFQARNCILVRHSRVFRRMFSNILRFSGDLTSSREVALLEFISNSFTLLVGTQKVFSCFDYLFSNLLH